MSEPSYWAQGMPVAHADRLEHDLSGVEVLIVGAGWTGLSLAWELAERGMEPVIVDQSGIAEGESQRTTAHVTNVLDMGFQEAVQRFGLKDAALLVKGHGMAMDRIQEVIRRNDIACDFHRVDGFLFPDPEEKNDVLQQEMQAYARAGISGMRWADKSEHPFADKGPGLCFAGQARIHPAKYLLGLAAKLRERGVRIYTGTHVRHLRPGRAVMQNGPAVNAKNIVVATHSPVINMYFFLKEAAFRSYVIAAKISKGAVPDALFWDTGRPDIPPHPYHYLRLQPSEDGQTDWLIAGGEDHKTGQARDYEIPFKRLEQWVKRHAPEAHDFDYHWSGQILEPNDGMAFIGRSPYHGRHMFLATGFSGNGTTYGMLAGMVLADLLQKKRNPFAKLFSPHRRPIGSSSMPFAKENWNVLTMFVKDRMTSGATAMPQLARGEGAVLEIGGEKTALFRDGYNRWHAYSPVCTHLKCMVHWNSAENTFDCPCHGSRYNGLGEVISGPALENLRPMPLPGAWEKTA